MRKYFDRRFDMRLAGKLAGLGYEIETQFKADGTAARSTISWDIKGIPDSVITKFSRRTGEVDATEKKIVAGMKQANPDVAGPFVGGRPRQAGGDLAAA